MKTASNQWCGASPGALVAPWLSERSVLLGICLRWTRGNLAEAEDLLGDACLRILEGEVQQLAAVDRPLAFWATVINNLGRDHSRRSRRWNFDPRDRGANLLGTLPARTASAEQQVFLKECLTATDRGLARLSERQRTAVLLRSAGIDYSEIGDVLSTTGANARKIVAAARVALRTPAGRPSRTLPARRPTSARRRLQRSYLVES
jgi:RNA polymerase sigma factor (sigma-70 family)